MLQGSECGTGRDCERLCCFQFQAPPPFSLSACVCVWLSKWDYFFTLIATDYTHSCLLGEFTFLEYLNWIEWRKKDVTFNGWPSSSGLFTLVWFVPFLFFSPPPPHDENNPEKSRGREKVDYNYYICFPIFPPRGRFSDLFPFFLKNIWWKRVVL